MEKKPKVGRPPTYPFGEMVVGEVIRVPRSSSLRSTASTFGKRNGKLFSVTAFNDFCEVRRVE